MSLRRSSPLFRSSRSVGFTAVGHEQDAPSIVHGEMGYHRLIVRCSPAVRRWGKEHSCGDVAAEVEFAAGAAQLPHDALFGRVRDQCLVNARAVRHWCVDELRRAKRAQH
jgi:hypothetical protein